MNLADFAIDGAARPDALTGFNPDFAKALEAMLAAAPPEIQAQLKIASGYRSPEVQAGLYDKAVAKYGSPEAARKWVAPPGRSQHNHGNAADLRYLDPAATDWAHKNAGSFGLAFPLSNENWHIEMAGARGQQPQGGSVVPLFAQPGTPPPTMPAGAPAAMPAGADAGVLASLFADQQAQRQARREAERADADARRAALLGQSVSSLYG